MKPMQESKKTAEKPDITNTEGDRALRETLIDYLEKNNTPGWLLQDMDNKSLLLKAFNQKTGADEQKLSALDYISLKYQFAKVATPDDGMAFMGSCLSALIAGCTGFTAAVMTGAPLFSFSLLVATVVSGSALSTYKNSIKPRRQNRKIRKITEKMAETVQKQKLSPRL